MSMATLSKTRTNGEGKACLTDPPGVSHSETGVVIPAHPWYDCHMMTKTHFEATASLIRGTYTETEGEADVVKNLAERMAAMFARENPRFDREKFLTACGL